MATERLAPDAILASSGLSGVVGAIQDDPDSPDGSWLTAPGSNTETEVRVSFPSPSGNPTQGTGLQEIRVLVRKTAQSTNPTATVELWEGGSLVSTLASTGVGSTTGVVLSGVWDATALGTADGSGVEVRVVGATGGGNPGNRASLEVGAIEWNVDYQEAAPSFNGDAAVTLPSLGASAAGTVEVPTYAGTAAVALAALVVSAAGAFVPPSFNGDAAVTLPTIGASAAGTVTGPSTDADAAVTLPSLLASAAGTVTVPTYAGAGAVTLPALGASSSGTVVGPGEVDLVALNAELRQTPGEVRPFYSWDIKKQIEDPSFDWRDGMISTDSPATVADVFPASAASEGITAREGARVVRENVKCSGTGVHRSEVSQLNSHGPNSQVLGVEFWAGFSFWLPSTWPDYSDFLNLIQWHSEGSGPPAFAIEREQEGGHAPGRLSLRTRYSTSGWANMQQNALVDTGHDIQLEAWNDVVVRGTLGIGDGSCDVWTRVAGGGWSQGVNLTGINFGITNVVDEAGDYWKFGFYGGSGNSVDSFGYHDCVRVVVGYALPDLFDFVAPGRGD